LKKEKNIIVVGAGIIGLCTAYYLSKKGIRVTVLDNTDGKDNCSYGNAGHIVPSHIIPLAAPGIVSQGLKWMLRSDSPFYIKPRFNKDLISWGLKFKKASTAQRVVKSMPVLNGLLMKSRFLIQELIEKENIEVGFNGNGLVIYCKTKEALKEETKTAFLAKRYGQRVEILDANEALKINPGLELDIKGAVWFKEDACLTPHMLMAFLKNILTEKHVEILHNHKVDSISSDKSGSITSITSNGHAFHADEYVLATGAWTSHLLKQLDIKLPLQAGKGYSFEVPQNGVQLTTSISLSEARVVAAPMMHGLRFAGTMEINGLDQHIRQQRIQGIVKSIPEYLPQFTADHFNDIKPWAGLRPCSPDGLPYIGRSKSCKNLLVATGHAMLGLSMGPITGQLISQLIAHEKPAINLGLLDVERYN